MCTNNSLTVDVIPDLIANNIIFQKLRKKPKSRWSRTHDRLCQGWGTSVNGLANSLVKNGLLDVNIEKGVEDRLDDETEHNE